MKQRKVIRRRNRKHQQQIDLLYGSGLFSAIRDKFKAVASSAKETAGKVLDKYLPLRKEGLLPPAVRTWLEQNGQKKVTSMTISRAPIEKYVEIMLNAITLGKFSQAIKKLGYDRAMHLFLQFDLEDGSRWKIEKNEVIMLTKYNGPAKNQEDMPVSNYQGNLNMADILENTRKQMGDANFSNYSAFERNCQDFILNILSANGLITEESRKFIMQDAQKIFQNLPGYTKGVSKSLTDLAARFNRFMKGEALNKNKNKITINNNNKKMPNAWLSHVAKIKAENPSMSYKEVLMKAKSSYNKSSSSSGKGVLISGRQAQQKGNGFKEDMMNAVLQTGMNALMKKISGQGVMLSGRNAPLRRVPPPRRIAKASQEGAGALPLPVPQMSKGRKLSPSVYPAKTPPIVNNISQKPSESMVKGTNNFAKEGIKLPVSRVARQNLGMYLA
jgi:hypothetical protein